MKRCLRTLALAACILAGGAPAAFASGSPVSAPTTAHLGWLAALGLVGILARRTRSRR